MFCFWMTDVAFLRVNDVMPWFCLVLWPHAMSHDVMPCFKNETWCHACFKNETWCHFWQIFCFSIGKLCFNFHSWLLSFIFPFFSFSDYPFSLSPIFNICFTFVWNPLLTFIWYFPKDFMTIFLHIFDLIVTLDCK